MARYSVTTGTIQVSPTTLSSRSQGRSFGIFASSGTVLFKRSSSGSAPDMSDAARVDFSTIPGMTYTCDPGITLWACASAGTINVDVLAGGER